MHFWNINAVAGALKEKKLTEKDQFNYFLVTFAIIGQITIFVAYVSFYTLVQGLVDFSLGTAITIIGLLACFSTNRAGDNENFLGRFFCLSLPVIVRLLVLTLLFFAAEIAILSTVPISVQTDSFRFWLSLFNTAVGSSLDILYFVWVRSKLKFVSG